MRRSEHAETKLARRLHLPTFTGLSEFLPYMALLAPLLTKTGRSHGVMAFLAPLLFLGGPDGSSPATSPPATRPVPRHHLVCGSLARTALIHAPLARTVLLAPRCLVRCMVAQTSLVHGMVVWTSLVYYMMARMPVRSSMAQTPPRLLYGGLDACHPSTWPHFRVFCARSVPH